MREPHTEAKGHLHKEGGICQRDGRQIERSSLASAPSSYSLASCAPNYLPSATGLDLEWQFSRNAGVEKEGKVALVQLCDVNTILLIHVSKMESAYTLSLSRAYLVYQLFVQGSPERSE